MSERVVSVTLKAQVADYLAGMERARKATSETGSEAEKLAKKKEAFDLLGKASLGLGLAAAAGVALAVAKYAEFDQAMSNVKASTFDASESTAETAARMDALGTAALDAGATTVFSAKESANAIEELAKAGIAAEDILGGALVGSLDLAAAGELGVARAAEIAAITLQQFKLEGADAGHVADVLAAGAGKALGSVDDLANGLKFVGPVANSMGVSLEETTGILALFAQQGIIGEQAGTGLRGVLASLTSPSSLARKEIEKLGITLYDANGKFLGMENAAGELSKAYSGMDDASRQASMGVIFGRETITAATTLYQAGAEGVAEWTTAVDDSGYAAQVAADRLDNLSGDVEALGGAFDTALIQTGAAGNDVLRLMTQSLTGLMDAYNGAPEVVKGLTLATGALTAVVGLAGAAFFLGAPKVAAFNAAVKDMGPSAQKAAGGLKGVAGFLGGPWGIAIGAATVLVAAMNTEIQKGVPTATEISNALATAADSAELFASATKRGSMETDLFGDYANGLKDLPGLLDKASDGFVGWMSLTANDRGALDSLKRVGDALGTLATNDLPAAADAFKDLADSQDLTKDQQLNLLNEMPGFREALVGVASEMGIAANDSTLLGLAMGTIKRPADESAEALEVLEGTAGATEESINDLAATIRGFADATLNTRDANRTLEESYDSLTAGIDAQKAAYEAANGTLDGFIYSLDIGSQAGRDNEAALDAIAQAAKESAASTLEQTGSQEQANAVLQTGRDKLIAMLKPFGITGEAAEAYADKLGLIPVAKETAIKADTAAATEKIRQFVRDLNNIPGRRDVVINQVVKQTGAARGEVGAAYASGGFTGFGGKYEPAGIVHRQEFVSTAETTSIPENRAALEFMHRGGVIPGYAGGGYVSGRNIQYAQSGGSRQAVNVSMAAPAIQRVSETVQFVLPNGRVLAESLREYDRSLL